MSKTLIELDLSWNKITSNGAVIIAEAIQFNATLQKLNISHNKISKSIITSFSRYLKHNSTLQEFIISWEDTSIAYVYISTTKCYVQKACLTYSIRHDQTQCFDCKCDSALLSARLQFDDTEAILLTSLVDKNVKKLEILSSKLSDDAARVIGDFLKADNILQEIKLSQNEISS